MPSVEVSIGRRKERGIRKRIQIGDNGDYIKMKTYVHNQCDKCHKIFRTALGFHRHYIQCLEKENV